METIWGILTKCVFVMDTLAFPDSLLPLIFRLHNFPWDMTRLSGIFGQKVRLTRIFLQIPAQIGARP